MTGELSPRNRTLQIYSKSFPSTPRLISRFCRVPRLGVFVFALLHPRVSLHHPCVACVIIASPGLPMCHSSGVIGFDDYSEKEVATEIIEKAWI
ncbi:MAG: hypothetical protein JJU37_16000 [Balneolaceae bacterium]|nr:hypothetical protein [Balneolaceae bacterium]